MRIKTLAIVAVATLTPFTAYAGSGCGGMKQAGDYHQMFKPAVRFHGGSQSGDVGLMKVGSYYGSSEKAYKTGSYGYSKPKSAHNNADIVDTAVASGSFNTLVTAVQEAGLVDTLKGDGPFTVFAPTDEAFAKLPPGTLESLLADKEQLTKVLTYHVVPGKVMSSDLKGRETLGTVEGSDIDSRSLRVTKADIVTSNGVIHVIDEVMIPQS